MTTLIGYARVSKADGSQVIDLQRDALAKAGVDLEHHLYTDAASGKRGIGLKVLAGEGALIDTTTANGRLVFAIFHQAGRVRARADR